MPLIKNLSDIKDLTPVEGGHEYDLRITKALPDKSKRTGRNGVKFIIDVQDEDYAKPLFHSIWFGNDGQFTGDDEEKSQNLWRMVKDFIRALGLDPEEDHEPEDFEDLEFSAILEYNDGKETDDEGNETQVYQPKNELGKITSV